MKRSFRLAFCGALLALATATTATIGHAAIVRLNLTEMVSRVDNAVRGQIIAKKAFRVSHPVDGNSHYTVLTIQGKSLIDGRDITVDVTYLGGVVSDTEATYNSEAPREQMTTQGRQVVVFYKHADDLGYGVSGNGIYAAHGGIYSVAKKGSKEVVLGRGTGYAVNANEDMPALNARITDIAREIKHARAPK